MKVLFTVIHLLVLLIVPAHAQWTSVGPGGNSLSSISFSDADYGWTCGSGGTMWRTVNGGTSWEAVTNFETPGSINRLRAIDAFSRSTVTTIFETTVGPQPTVLYQAQNAACTCRVFEIKGNGTFNNFSLRTSNIAVLVGDNGTALIGSGNGSALFSNTPSGTQANLRDADCPTSNVAYVVGDGGVIRRTNATRNGFVAQNSTTSARLNGVWFTSADQGCVVGAGGTILRTSDGGTTWTRISSPTTVNLYDVRFTSVSAGLAVGELGTILLTTDGGLSWRTEPSGTLETLYSLSSTTDGTRIWAAGDGGTVLRRGAIVLASRPLAFGGQVWGAYPNPFSDGLTVDLPQLTTRRLEASLRDATGRVVFRQDVSGRVGQRGQALAVPAALAPGIYLLELLADEQRAETRRLVKLP